VETTHDFMLVSSDFIRNNPPKTNARIMMVGNGWKWFECFVFVGHL
jgi:hypothetical protein